MCYRQQSSFVCFCSSLYFLCSLEVIGLFVHLLYARCLRRVMRLNPRLVEACCGEFAGDVLFM